MVIRIDGQKNGDELSVEMKQQMLKDEMRSAINKNVSMWLERNLKLIVDKSEHGFIEQAVDLNNHKMMKEMSKKYDLSVRPTKDRQGYNMFQKFRSKALAHFSYTVQENDGKLDIDLKRIDVDGPYDPTDDHPLERDEFS